MPIPIKTPEIIVHANIIISIRRPTSSQVNISVRIATLRKKKPMIKAGV
jgi:hypothetical protein